MSIRFRCKSILWWPLLAITIVGLPLAEDHAGDVRVARSPEGRIAWTVVRDRSRGEQSRDPSGGKVVLTEVWVATGKGEPRRVRIFPGRIGEFGWEGENLVCADSGLRLALTNEESGTHGTEVVLIPGKRWAISLDRDEDIPAFARIPETRAQSALATRPVFVPAESDPAALRVLEAMLEGMNLAQMAYLTAERGEFSEASTYYRQVADRWERMSEDFRKIGLTKTLCRHYVQILRLRAEGDRREMARTICADHLRIIGGFLTQYRGAHEGVYPEDLASLKAWVERDIGCLSRVFRSPVDADTGQVTQTGNRLFARVDRMVFAPGKGRDISYGYRRPRFGDPDGAPIAWSYFYQGRMVELMRSGDDYRVIDRPGGKPQADSLLALGMRLLEADSLTAGAASLDAATRIYPGMDSPSLARAYSRLGYAYLRSGDLDRAELSLTRATGLNLRLAEAHRGLGMVYRGRPKGLYTAIHHFQKALQWDPRSVEARCLLAETRLKLREYDARKDAELAIALDPKYPPPYRLLGEWHELMMEDYQTAVLWYLRYMGMKPDDPQARLSLGRAYLKVGDFEKTTRMLMDYVQGHPEDFHVLPILAQACQEMKRLDWALTFYRRYLDQADASERMLYEDIRLVAYPEDLARYERATRSGDKEAFLRRFWADRDPDLVTPINERLLEHYRRVSYSRIYFSQTKQPWDRRGDVYVRFGEPDHRARSKEASFQQNAEVQRVKEQLAREMYGQKAAETYLGPVFPVKGSRFNLTEAPNDRGGLYRGPVRAAKSVGYIAGNAYRSEYQPVTLQDDPSLVPWETWVYTRIGDGFEITFTDESGSGSFDYAPPVLDANLSQDQLKKINRYAPQRVFEGMAAVTADAYTPRTEAAPLKFYYDMADFRGEKEGRSLLEVYYGIPRTAGRYLPEQDTTLMIVERRIALLDLESGASYSTSRETVFHGRGDLTKEAGAFIPDVAELEVPPGRYRMEVSAKDRLSGRMGTYRQDVGLLSYAKGPLRLSGIVLAWQVGEGEEGDKFTRHGIKIVPLPTRTFRKGQNVFVYYEVYNLKPDTAGTTSHSVEYTIRTEAGSLLSRAFPNLGGRRPGVAVSQSQAGRQEAEYRYIELDLKELSPGKGTVSVTVKDLNSGAISTRELAFTMME